MEALNKSIQDLEGKYCTGRTFCNTCELWDTIDNLGHCALSRLKIASEEINGTAQRRVRPGDLVKHKQYDEVYQLCRVDYGKFTLVNNITGNSWNGVFSGCDLMIKQKGLTPEELAGLNDFEMDIKWGV